MMNQVIEFMNKMKRKMQRRGFVMIHSLCKSKQQSRRQASPVETIGQASADSASVAMIYRSELDYISRCILDSKTIERVGSSLASGLLQGFQLYSMPLVPDHTPIISVPSLIRMLIIW